MGKGIPLEHVLNDMGMVVEGVKTTKSAYILAKRYHIDMPITNELYQVLFEDKNPKTAVEHLMGRDRTTERPLQS